MKRLISALLALSMLVATIGGAAAQETPTSVATGLDTPAAYFDSRGNEVATLSVTAVENDWQDYEAGYDPERGNVFRAVSFTVTNVSDASFIVTNYSLSLLDTEGRNTSSSWVTPAADADAELFEDDVPLAPGESADLILVFETLAEVEPAALVWQPEYGQLVVVQFADAAAGGAIANGIGAVSTYVDNRGDVVAELEVTGLNTDWRDYDEYSEPERGTTYVAVEFTITNVTDASVIVEPYSFTLLDSTGLNTSAAWATPAEDADVELFSEDVPLAAGESYDGVLVFSLYTDVTPAALVWQPESGVINLVTLGESGAQPTDLASPVATPAN